ncbi:GalNAc-alpha-(1-_4)-GalNAc-alpha-(1-_3)-diNAcBac-PP-undecaprenol alpha-1,4-N-acetyl-D-galactosaminyltransferase [Polaribacter huanghezhanensis]|uniref:glycosyltransferase n=1 Tax=Polaribacter huanghezhanensis TaxID=1354726 RepID=UPI002648F76F|nr:glycosyltransferase [Polaribacter huanghezhanensis]WKD86099.1 GalNAc-alpha-(1->4)-GalNAc-alpha-(1->3)-diNAcBac-PP-undecaprenol alpha-1,4-N-acetyl-D-galactosaminyltransferase [Polaribacter huanghezhanensis]
MNILFLYTANINPQLGGVERVTVNLAGYFEKKGLSVIFLALPNNTPTIDKRQYFLPDPTSAFTKKNINYFQSFLIEKSISLVINQGGNNIQISKLASYCKINKVKLISVVHNSLLATINNFSFIYQNKFQKLGLDWITPFLNTKFFSYILRKSYIIKYGKHYKALCGNSNYVFLLSEKYKEELEILLNGKLTNNVIGMPNPIVYNDVKKCNKKKEVLYVGRVNSSQKRVDLLLKIWSLIEVKHSDWTLNIVGGGDELESMKQLSGKLNLKNVFFHGFTDPKPFYETASIFTMTSSFEGLPMTILESMQYGLVPIAFDSFLSAKDLIDDKENGFLITPFNVNEYVKKLSLLMSSSDDLERISNQSKQKVKNFDLSVIGKQWITLFKELNNS